MIFVSWSVLSAKNAWGLLLRTCPLISSWTKLTPVLSITGPRGGWSGGRAEAAVRHMG